MQQYDVIVEGINFGTLAAASLLVGAGKKVLITTEASSAAEASGAEEEEGVFFLPGPWCSFGVEAGGDVRNLFDDLGLTNPEPMHVVNYQVALPGRRITVFKDQVMVLAELKREFPAETNAIEEFYRRLVKISSGIEKSKLRKYLAERSAAWRFIRRFHFSPELQSFFDIQARYFFGLPLTSMSLISLLRLCLTRPVALPGGRALTESLAAAVVRRGGVIRYGQRDTEIVFRRSRAIGLKVSGEEVGGRSILIGDTTSNDPTVVYLGVHGTVIPVGMLARVLYLPDYSRPSRFIAVSVDSSDDRKTDSRQLRQLMVEMHSGDQSFSDVELIDRCSELIPFLREHIVIKKPVSRHGSSRHVKGLTLRPQAVGKKDKTFFKTSRSHLAVYRSDSDCILSQVKTIRSVAKKLI